MINLKSRVLALTAPLVLMFALPANAALRVFACEPEWGALAQELGGKLVDVSVATSALQDRQRQGAARPTRQLRRGRRRSKARCADPAGSIPG